MLVGTSFQPDVVLASLGFDAREDDPQGNMRLQTSDFGRIGPATAMAAAGAARRLQRGWQSSQSATRASVACDGADRMRSGCSKDGYVLFIGSLRAGSYMGFAPAFWRSRDHRTCCRRRCLAASPRAAVPDLVEPNDLRRREHGGAFDGVLELADVPWPRTLAEPA